MPEEARWRAFFDADRLVAEFGCAGDGNASVVEFGCGYGTFTLPAARRTRGSVHAFDIEPAMVELVRRKAAAAGLANVRVELRDFLAAGTGLPDRSIEHAMIYNLLHVEGPVDLLREAYRILRPGGTLSIIHWKYDAATPRGPSLAIRPRLEQCRAWAEQAGFVFLRSPDLSAYCPYHYGLLLARPPAERERED